MIQVLGKELSGEKDREALKQPGKEEKFLPREDTGEAPSRSPKAALTPPALCRRCHEQKVASHIYFPWKNEKAANHLHVFS